MALTLRVPAARAGTYPTGDASCRSTPDHAGARLRIVFSSVVVPSEPGCRSSRVPRPRDGSSTSCWHRMVSRSGRAGGTLQIVRAQLPEGKSRRRRTMAPKKPAPQKRPHPLPASTANTSRSLTPAPLFGWIEGSYRRCRSWTAASSISCTHGLSEDPIRVIQASPRVTAVDDFRKRLRRSGQPLPSMLASLVDGVSTPWLQHTAYGRGATGSLPMLSAQVLERATLRTGAFPRRHGDTLGPELDLTLREGSRTDFGASPWPYWWFERVNWPPRARSAGQARPVRRMARGSWPHVRATSNGRLNAPRRRGRRLVSPMDCLKMVLDLGRSQQVALTALGGISSIDGEDNEDTLSPVKKAGNGTNRAWLVNLSWRSKVGRTLVIRRPAYAVAQDVSATSNQGGETSDGGANRSIAYRIDFSRAAAHGFVRIGGVNIEADAATARPDPRGTVTGVTGSSMAAFGLCPSRLGCDIVADVVPGHQGHLVVDDDRARDLAVAARGMVVSSRLEPDRLDGLVASVPGTAPGRGHGWIVSSCGPNALRTPTSVSSSASREQSDGKRRRLPERSPRCSAIA